MKFPTAKIHFSNKLAKFFFKKGTTDTKSGWDMEQAPATKPF